MPHWIQKFLPGILLGLMVSGCGTEIVFDSQVSPVIPLDFSNGQSASLVLTGVTAPSGVAVSGGDLYLASNATIQKASPLPTISGSPSLTNYPRTLSGYGGITAASSGAMALSFVAEGGGGYVFGMLGFASANDLMLRSIRWLSAASPGAIHQQCVSDRDFGLYGGDAGDVSVSPNGSVYALADVYGHRVRLLVSPPASASSSAATTRMLGQTSGSVCSSSLVSAGTLQNPQGVWTDGTRVVVADTGNHRVLIWNSFPTSDGQSASLWLGQASATSSSAGNGASGMSSPSRVFSDGTSLFVSDSGNHRVLFWKKFPTQSGQPADAVLGQADFSGSTSGSAVNRLNTPRGLTVSDRKLLVADFANDRVLVFQSL